MQASRRESATTLSSGLSEWITYQDAVSVPFGSFGSFESSCPIVEVRMEEHDKEITVTVTSSWKQRALSKRSKKEKEIKPAVLFPLDISTLPTCLKTQGVCIH